MLHKRLQHRRHEVQRRHAVLTGSSATSRAGSRCAARLRHHQPRPRHQRPEELPYRHVKAERRLLQHHVVARQPIGVLHPRQTIVQTLMGVGRPLRACRSSPRYRSCRPDDRHAAAKAPARPRQQERQRDAAPNSSASSSTRLTASGSGSTAASALCISTTPRPHPPPCRRAARAGYSGSSGR